MRKTNGISQHVNFIENQKINKQETYS